jgi:hypothetical protein
MDPLPANANRLKLLRKWHNQQEHGAEAIKVQEVPISVMFIALLSL